MQLFFLSAFFIVMGKIYKDMKFFLRKSIMTPNIKTTQYVVLLREFYVKICFLVNNGPSVNLWKNIKKGIKVLMEYLL